MNNKRHQEILAIIRDTEVTNQDVLIDELRRRGFVVTQPTVSRDIARLGLRKSLTDKGVYCYCVPETLKTKKFAGVFSQAVRSIMPALNTVVVKTYQGMASAVCVALETMEIPLVVGSIAGDDTIFIMTRSEKDAAELVVKLRKLL
ncbi:MAG: hypothetical protein FWG45_00455 [Oscillospiraceae bacterium]|nr:hypothetical protein [Oscillospiraceae bacterium]